MSKLMWVFVSKVFLPKVSRTWQNNKRKCVTFKILYQESWFFSFFFFLVPGNLNLKFPTRFKHFNLFSPINFPFKRHVPHVFKLWLDNELSNIRTFHSITMLMLSLIYIKPICEKNIVSNTLKPDFVGKKRYVWDKTITTQKHVTCGTFSVVSKCSWTMNWAI